MNTHVNFEIAKLLKEKGFNEPCFDAYNIQGMKFSNGWLEYIADNDIELPFTKKDLNPQDILAPTITEVVMWLYDKHGVWIGVTKYKDHGDDVNDPYYFTPNNGRHIYKTPTEAYEARIKFTLKKLI